MDKLRDINWLYRTLDENSVDKATKTIKVVSNTSNPMLERASVISGRFRIGHLGQMRPSSFQLHRNLSR